MISPRDSALSSTEVVTFFTLPRPLNGVLVCLGLDISSSLGVHHREKIKIQTASVKGSFCSVREEQENADYE